MRTNNKLNKAKSYISKNAHDATGFHTEVPTFLTCKSEQAERKKTHEFTTKSQRMSVDGTAPC